MYLRILGLIFLLNSVSCWAQEAKSHEVTIISSKFDIDGETNVNKFHCDLFQRVSEGMLEVQSTWKDYLLSFEGLKLRYPVRYFDCGFSAMNEDMQDLLKSKEFPYLYLEIHNIRIDPSNSEIELLNVAAQVSITIAGVTRTYDIKDGMVQNRTEEDLTFRGNRLLKLTDFGLQPPTKFFGMVQVTNELKIDFEIDMHVETL